MVGIQVDGEPIKPLLRCDVIPMMRETHAVVAAIPCVRVERCISLLYSNNMEKPTINVVKLH